MANSTNITESLLSITQRWHGNIDEQYSNIGNLLNVSKTYTKWDVPLTELQKIEANYNDLGALIAKCRSALVLPIDRERRNILLKATVALCVINIKFAAYTGYNAGQLTSEQIHQLGFLLPGELGGYHKRAEPTDVLAEVKVRVINEDFIRVVIDQSADENAARVFHGWPTGVKNAVIVITSTDDDKVVYNRLTTHLYNDIRMPDGSRGRQFIIKAAFLRHPDDEPRFGSEPTFSMPLTTEDLTATLDRQHHEDFEAQIQEVENQRREIERLRAELNAKK
jgi:hypothetical protein